MRARLLVLTICATFLVAPALNVTAEEDEKQPCVEDQEAEATELKAEVPELTEFHEVIYPLWHKAWPEKDFQWMKDLLPKVQDHVKAVQQVNLPGILRDKQNTWDQEVANLTATLEEYEKATSDDDEDGLLAAVEKLHSNFETLVRTIRPVMKELDAYHVELYKIYHHHLPDEDLELLRVTAATMGERCAELTEAEIPRWYKDKAERLAAGFHDLCLRTEALNEVLKGDDWDVIVDAVESVHTHYQKVEHLFD